MTGDTIERLAEVAKWFHHSKGMLPKDDLAKRLDFHEIATDLMMEVLALVVRDVQEATARKAPSLYLPRGMKVTGDLTRLG